MSTTTPTAELPMDLCAQVARIDDERAVQLGAIMKKLPAPAEFPPALQKGTCAQVLELLEEEFCESAGIELWIELHDACLLTPSVTRYVRYLCRRIDFDEATAFESAEESDVRADRIADELKAQLSKYVGQGASGHSVDGDDEQDSSGSEDSGDSDEGELSSAEEDYDGDSVEDDESGKDKAPEAQHVCKRARR